VADFEYTSDNIVFDLLNLSLYHGWLADPQSQHATALGDLTYNQVVDYIISKNSSDKEEEVTKGE